MDSVCCTLISVLKKSTTQWTFLKEVWAGFEPANKGFADPCLRPLGNQTLLIFNHLNIN